MLINLRADELFERVSATLAAFFRECGRKSAVLGLSGGIDSAVVACIAVNALGKDNVHGLIMPSPFSTLHSVSDAVELAVNLEIGYDIIPIESILNRFSQELEPVFKKGIENITQENIQARIRGVLLMAYSNQSGALVLNTSNKSELSVGYGTLYGDLAGAVMVLADIYKLDVYELARYINSVKESIPDSTMTKPPSAELSPGQKDSDQLPVYEILDPVLFALNECGKSPSEIIGEADTALVKKVIELKEKASFKRFQLPQMIQVGDHPLMPEKCVRLNPDAY